MEENIASEIEGGHIYVFSKSIRGSGNSSGILYLTTIYTYTHRLSAKTYICPPQLFA